MSCAKTRVQRILKCARTTFERVSRPSGRKKFALSKEEFQGGIVELAGLMDSLRSGDVCLEKSKVLLGSGKIPDPAPVTYIKIYEDDDVSVGIFIVRSGNRIPLHNHPNMHGILKVIYGTVDVSVYTKTDPGKSGSGVPEPLRKRPAILDHGLVVPTEKCTLKNLTPESKSLVLSPDDNNFHEIVTVGEGGCAAFFDILAPPYSIEENGDDDARECHFFREVYFDKLTGAPANGCNQKLVWLQRIQPPRDYFCDTEPYLGPSLIEHNHAVQI